MFFWYLARAALGAILEPPSDMTQVNDTSGMTLLTWQLLDLTLLQNMETRAAKAATVNFTDLVAKNKFLSVNSDIQDMMKRSLQWNYIILFISTGWFSKID